MFLIEKKYSMPIDMAGELDLDFSRWVAGVVPALIITLGLIFIMHELIYVDYVEAPAEEPFNFEPLHYQEIIIETRIDDRPKQPEKPTDPPPTLTPQTEHLNELDVSVPKLPMSGDTFKLDGISGLSSMPVAAYMVAAKYPSGAIRRGIEGYVDVGFDVNEAGIPKNIYIIRAEPEGEFEQAAIEAVSRWRYKPKMVDGIAKYSEGLTKRIRFEMSKEG